MKYEDAVVTPLSTIVLHATRSFSVVMLKCAKAYKAYNGKDNHISYHHIISMLDLGPEGIVDRGSWMP